VVTPKNPNSTQLYATAASKKEDITTTLAYTLNVQTVDDGISRRVTSGRAKHQFDTCRWQSQGY